MAFGPPGGINPFQGYEVKSYILSVILSLASAHEGVNISGVAAAGVRAATPSNDPVRAELAYSHGECRNGALER